MMKISISEDIAGKKLSELMDFIIHSKQYVTFRF